MSTPNPTFSKKIEFTQDEKIYKIELIQKKNNILFSVKDIDEINDYYMLEISFEDILKKNLVFKIYNNIEELMNAIEQFIINKNILLTKNNNGLILDLFVYNIMTGNKEKVIFELNKTENTNKDEIIKSLCLKVNNLEQKHNILKEKYDKIMIIIEPLIKAEESKFKFQWENHDNCELSNNNKTMKKIKNEGWNTNVKGNRILRKNATNIFKIRVNNNLGNKSGLSFGISRSSAIFSSSPYSEEWIINCYGTNTHNSKFKDFKNEQLNKGDIVTFIVDLNNGSLSVKKNDIYLGTLYNIPKDEDLVPCCSNYYIGNEIEIIE